jgi:hypothetical protein
MTTFERQALSLLEEIRDLLRAEFSPETPKTTPKTTLELTPEDLEKPLRAALAAKSPEIAAETPVARSPAPKGK